MPLVGGSMTDLQARVDVIAIDGTPVSSSAIITRIWLINGSQVWDAFSRYGKPLLGPGVLSMRLRSGPFWEPYTDTDVVVQVSIENVNYLLRSTQLIWRWD